ncbi:MAG: hypothetical protein LC772_00270 [Chloroflexi bacterium]|nr:hypothetical protein [Chloroflexota bacterium]
MEEGAESAAAEGGERVAGAESGGNRLFHAVDHNISKSNRVASTLRDMGHRAQSVAERYVSTATENPDIVDELNGAFGDNWRVITKDIKKDMPGRGFPSDKIIHVKGGNSMRTHDQVIEFLRQHHGF